MDFQEYIKSELLILVPVLYIIGLGLKKSKLKDKWIPIGVRHYKYRALSCLGGCYEPNY